MINSNESFFVNGFTAAVLIDGCGNTKFSHS